MRIPLPEQGTQGTAVANRRAYRIKVLVHVGAGGLWLGSIPDFSFSWAASGVAKGRGGPRHPAANVRFVQSRNASRTQPLRGFAHSRQR